MLLSIVKEFESAQSRLGVDPYAAWSAAVRQLQSDWQEGNKANVGRLRDYIKEVPEDQRYEALQDLIAEHLQLAWHDGQGTDLHPYLSRFGQDFAQLASPVAVPAELIEDEFLARHILPHGDTPSIDEYQRRFPSRPDVMQLLHRRCFDGGRYVKLREIGRGAMGEVFEAYDRRLGRLVAIKQPKPRFANAADVLGRFAEEARLTAGLQHPAIVTVHEHCQGGATPFYVMRLAFGQPLSENIRDYHQPPAERSRSDQRLVWRQLLQTFATVCQAIVYAHSRGVLHRDLKPDNIIVGEFGETTILDWGMASSIPLAGNCSSGRASVADAATRDAARESRETASLLIGTPQYMPPEQARGISDARSDVFGLGAILYEMLTESPPHAWPEGSRPADWLQVVRDAQFPPPRRLKPRLPRALEAICLKALARDPQARYRSVAEMTQDVLRHQAGEAVAAKAESNQLTCWRRWIRRHRLRGESQ